MTLVRTGTDIGLSEISMSMSISISISISLSLKGRHGTMPMLFVFSEEVTTVISVMEI